MHSRKYYSLLSITFLILFAIGCIFCFEANAGSRFPMAEPVNKRLIIERTYLFYVMQYDSPVEVKVLENTPEMLKYKYIFAPEKTAIAYLSAQAQGNYEWYHSLLSKPLQQKLEAELAKTKKTSTDLAKEWQKKFKNKKVELTHRIERGSYSIIRYRIVSDGVVTEEKDIALKQSGSNWIVEDLTGDPVYEDWDFAGTEKRIQKK